MGFYYRKSIRFGPFRVNVSKSGVGYSIGGGGLRAGVDSRGRRYTTFNIPGTGVGYRTSQTGSGKGCLFIAVILLAFAAILKMALL